jgi:hypothetical protein
MENFKPHNKLLIITNLSICSREIRESTGSGKASFPPGQLWAGLQFSAVVPWYQPKCSGNTEDSFMSAEQLLVSIGLK